MNITLHLGAHRCANTSFRHYLRAHKVALRGHDIGVWGPERTRAGLFRGLFPGPHAGRGRDLTRRANGRVQLHLNWTRRQKLHHLLVSDENMIGSAHQCVRYHTLYPAIGDRMSRISAAFGAEVTTVLLRIRAQDLWWASAVAFTVGQGYPVPNAKTYAAIAEGVRTWRDVITDLACAMPNAQILVLPFEQYAGQPHRLLECATGLLLSVGGGEWRNRSPDMQAVRAILAERADDPDMIPDEIGRWQPFDAAQISQLQENYADDLHWLTAGADGLATLIRDQNRIKTGSSLQAGDLTEGQQNDIEERKLA